MASLKQQVFLRILLLPVFVWLVILVPAGTLDFWQVYVYFAVIMVLAIGSVSYLLKHDPELIERRLRVKEKQSTQQKLMALLVLQMIVGYVIPGLDRRFGWSDIPVWLVLFADLLAVIAYLFMMYVMTVNSYAARTVDVEPDQELITNGPYGLVRHPLYAGALLLYLATPIALGSWWGLIPFMLVPAILVPRILNEEKVLKAGLDGYNDYCVQVKWRLLPYIW